MRKLSRRSFIVSSSALAASSFLSAHGCKHVAPVVKDTNGDNLSVPQLEIETHTVVYADDRLNSFPSVGKLTQGGYFLAFRQAPDWSYRYGRTEIDPSSEALNVRSANGVTWSQDAQELYSNFLHGVDRPVINVLRDGSLFCTFHMWQVDMMDPGSNVVGVPIFEKWVGKIKGAYSLRSNDGGKSWDTPLPLPEAARLGRESVQLKDGSILSGSYSDNITIYQTKDKGSSWSKLAVIPNPNGFSLEDPVLYLTKGGKIVCFAKAIDKHGNAKRSTLITTESMDGGVTWSNVAIRKIQNIGAPHLLRLNDDFVLLTYKDVSASPRILAAVLDADCSNVDEVAHHVIRKDGLNDIEGNTSAVMLDSSKLMVLYSNSDRESNKQHISGTICNIKS